MKFFERFKRPKVTTKRVEEAIKFSPKPSEGLNDAQIQSRIEDGLINKTKKTFTKSYFKMFTDNFLNFFNIMLYIVLVLLLIAQSYGNLVFVFILFCNSMIGLVQDIYARKISERLRILINPIVAVVRNGQTVKIRADEVVLNDILIIRQGEQICADGHIVEGEVTVDESLLTGESESVLKNVKDEVKSGTIVMGGKAKMLVETVGSSNYVEKLQQKAKESTPPKSQILRSINLLFRVIAGFLILVSIMYLIYYIYVFVMDSSQIEFSSSVSVFSGALVGLIPSGLYLLTSITLTVGTIRLNLKRMFVQQFYSIEMLSRVDTLCLDKTGTITNGEMDLIEIVSLNNLSKTRIKNYLRTLLDATDDDNATARAINKAIENEELMPLQSAYSLPFLSKTKYSAVVLSNRESIVLGAREFVLSKKDNANKRALQYEKDGYRVLVLARVGHGLKRGEKIRNAKAMGLLVFLDYIKEDASETIEWFKQNDVNIKIISGDNALTTSQIAKRVGVVNADNYISLEDVDNETLANSVNDYSVFGRVTPEQKEIIIESLIKSKHVVAMTGDGVNDILALKKADCSIAMAGGSQAARNASHLVSLDSNFSKLPEVVKEGRRVINNLQRTASVFLVKTTFSLILSMFFFIWAITWLIKDGTVYSIYPFQPQNLYVWEFCTIAIASFSLSLEPNNERIKSSFLKNILLKALPIAIFMVIPVFIYFFISYFSPDLLSQEGMVVMSVITFVILSFLYLIVICYPYNLYRIILLGGLSVIVCAFFCVDYLLGGSVLGLSYNALNADNYWILLVVLFSSIIAVCAYYFVMHQISTNISKRKNAQDQQGS